MFEDDDNFDSLFAEEDEQEQESVLSDEVWKVLIVDDEQDIHSAIKLALNNFVFENKRIQFYDAYSAEQAQEILTANTDIALILLDVVMETSHAGLDFVGYIRNELKNHFIRVILWTGQPGYAPKKDVILQYEINDYKTKTDLTDDTIFTTVLASIRSFNAIMIIESFRQDLEQKVIERTATIQAQQKKITDSIMYAEKIQRSILPAKEVISDVFPNSFVLYKPKQVVSGDFYWMYKASDHEIYIAAADCTGHGVPGAFMSMIGTTLLNEIVNSKKILEPSEILKELNKGIIEALTKHSRSEDAQSDGMDISLCRINLDSGVLDISLANHSAMLVRQNELEILEGEMASIGGFFSMMRTPDYTQHTISFQSGDRVYLYSDGIQDQFGGEHSKKFTLTRLKNKIAEIQNIPMSEQAALIDKEITSWMGREEQLDDIVCIGIQL